MTDTPKSTAPYSVLAAGYDLVMAHVDYESWAEYIDHLIEKHGPDDRSVPILELACGTGSLAIELAGLGYTSIRATDRSPEMIAVARRKAVDLGAHIEFGVEDFLVPADDRRYDVVLLLYDGLNYVLERDTVAALLSACGDRLTPDGLLIFDQSTPSNSINNEPYFEDEGEEGDFRYERRSRYDRESRVHTTTLDIHVGDRVFREQHVQRAYDQAEIASLLESCGLDVLAAYDGFSLEAADERAERIHWVVKRLDFND